jgi:hypothetical protein
MSQDARGNPLEPDPTSSKRGWGCGTILLALLALVVLGRLSLWLYEEHLDRSAMRQNLVHMGVGRWADCPSKVEIWHVFSGSESHYYKLTIPPQDVDQFLASLSGFERPPKIVHGGFPGSANIHASWWRPKDEKELLLVEQRVDNSTGGWTLWYAAAAKDTGNVYMYRVGHCRSRRAACDITRQCSGPGPRV